MLPGTSRRSDPVPAVHSPAPPEPSGLAAAAGDAIAVAYLAVVLVVTVLFDGGLDAGGLLLLGGTALLTVPVVLLEAARTTRPIRILLLMWGLGIVVSVAFAVHRVDMTEAILTYALPPVAFLVAIRLGRRPWGDSVLVGVIAASWVVYGGQAFLRWLGPPLEHMRSNWLAVSWHNPTGALMGSFAVLALALSVRHRPRWAVPAAVWSALSLAGLWLTGSRGAMIATVLGLVVAAVASRDAGWRRIATTGAGVLVGATVVVALLLQLGGLRTSIGDQPGAAAAGEAEPVTPRLVRIEPNAAHNLRTRFAHMDAGLSLFSQHPVTGAGMGAYGQLGNRLASPGANLTLSAHNEFVEALAEGGLLFGLTFLMSGAAAGFVAVRRAWEVERLEAARVSGLAAGAAGVAVLLLVHTAVDIDWRYPVIPALLATVVAILWDRRTTETGSWTAGLAAVPLVLALALGVTAAAVEGSARTARVSDGSDLAVPAAPWDLHRRVQAARTLARDGDLSGARDVLAPAARWNAKSPEIDVMQDVIAYRAGDLTASQLTSGLGGQRTGAATYVLVGEALLDDGHLSAASTVIEEGFALTSEHPGTPYARDELWELRIRQAAAVGDCLRAERLASEAVDDPDVQRYVADVEDRTSEILDEQCPRR